MSILSDERRIYKRVFFSASQGPQADFYNPESPGKPISTTILDLSLGGLGLLLRKNGEPLLEEGDLLILKHIKGLKNANLNKELKTVVRWIQNYHEFKHILFGCEFINLSDHDQDLFKNEIDTWAENVSPKRQKT